jgi:predicted dehydrogenase
MAFRVGLVGLGMAVTPHAKSLMDLKDRVEVAYAFSPSERRRTAFAQRFPFPLCDRLETILEDRSIGAVLILTPPNTHLELVSRFAAAGKHILLEKPLEISAARAEQLVKSSSGVKLGVVLQHRFRPAAEKLREVIGDLGKLVSASASIPNWRPQSYYDQPGRGTKARDGGGVLLTQGIHTLDLLLSFAGEAAEVRSFSTTTPVHRMETEDLVSAAVR